MILRLVYSFFFISLVTGDQLGHYGYPADSLINANPVNSVNPQAQRETRSFDVKYVFDESPGLQVQLPVQYFEDETEYTEKTICFTPSMVHKMIKAALEYVSHAKMPSDINNIVEKLDQELNRMSEMGIEENAVRKPLYPLDSKTIFQIVDKSRSKPRTNLILKYELPSVKEPLCRETLEKLIEIAYTAYLELEEQPQCRDYLYNFAAHQPEDRPTAHLNQGPDLKPLIASILDQIDKHKPNLDISQQSDRHGDIPVNPDIPTPQYNIPQVQEYKIPQKPQNLEYNIPQQPQTLEYNIPQQPQTLDYNIPQQPQTLDYNIPQQPQTLDYNIPQVQEYKIPQKPQNLEYNIPQQPQTLEYNIPQQPQTLEYNIPQQPQTLEYNIPQQPQNLEYNIPQQPQTLDYNIPQIQEYKIPHKPQSLEYNIPQQPQPLEYNIPQQPQTLEYNNPKQPQPLEYNIPQLSKIQKTKTIHTYTVPDVPEYKVQELNVHYNVPEAPELIKPKFNLPIIHEYNINEYNVPKPHEYSITQSQESIYPEINEYVTVTKNTEYNVPKLHEYSITHEYNVPNVHEYTITQSHESNIPQIQDILPQVQSIEMPEIHETIYETVEDITPMKPEETINILVKLLPKNDQVDIASLLDRLMNIVEENQNNFNPRISKHLLTLLKTHKQNNIPKFNDIFLLLLNSQKNRDWPWSDRVTEQLLSYLKPDHNGNLDPRIVEIILNVYKRRPNEQQVEFILSLLRPFKEGKMDSNIGDLVLKLILLHQNNLMRPDHVDILLKLLKLSQKGYINPIDVEIIAKLSKWSEIGLSPNQVNGLIALLKPYVNGHPDRKPVYITHFLLTKGRHLNSKQFDFILSFLYPENGVLNTRRIDIINFILNNLPKYPESIDILFTLLQENAPGVLNSRFLDILLLLNNKSMLTQELAEILINLLVSEVAGQLEDHQVKNLFFLLAPHKQSNPKLVVDVLTLLNQGGLHGNIIEWFERTTSNRDSKPNIVKLVEVQPEYKNEFRTPDGGYQTVDTPQVPFQVQGLITQDQGSNTDLVNKILEILEVGQRELGVVELTYMLKHEKPLIYQPVYYVKYRLPILSFISNMKNLLHENPNLNADPIKLLQELIVDSNVTEVSPNLQGFPKEEILKLTYNDGDLVQAKVLDEQNLSLNDQINYVHGLNVDITPEEILQLNQINEAKYFPNLLELKGKHTEILTLKDVDKFINVAPVHYKHFELPAVSLQQSHPQIKTIHSHQQTYIARDNPNQDALNDNNAQLSSQK